MGALIEDYIAGNESISPFFPRRLQDWLVPNAPAHTLPPAFRDELLAYQRHFGNEAAIPESAQFIVTGQQPALFGGPLYTLYKLLTVWRLAQHVESETGTPCVPVFWLAGDDHDFAEAQSIAMRDRNGAPFWLRYEPSFATGDTPLHAIPLEDALHALIDRAADRSPGAASKPVIRDFLHDSLTASSSLHDWSGRILAGFSRYAPVLIFAPHLPEARRAAIPILEREIRLPLESTTRLNTAGARLDALGYGAQVVKGANEVNFFLECRGKRRKVTFDDGQFHVSGEGMSYHAEDLIELLHSEPERFSPNVVLRPVVQQRLFSPLAYIGGPGEIAYWAQMASVFEQFGESMPAVFPRARALLMTPKERKLQQRLGFPADLWTAPLQVWEDAALRTVPENSALLQETDQPRRSVLAALEGLSIAMAGHGGGYKAKAERLAQRVTRELTQFERSLLRADQERAATARSRARRIAQAYAPFGKPQERILSPFTFFFEHGFELIDRIRDEIDVTSFQLSEIEL